MVMHVHGAHVGPGSDGYPEAWWLPAASNIPDTYATEGTFFESLDGKDTENARGKGYALDRYPNDQPTTTLWYHDHTLGITRLNVYAGGAGFYLIRGTGDKETGLLRKDSDGKRQVLPGPAPKVGKDPNCFPRDVKGLKAKAKCMRKRVREIPIAIQPKSFNADGSQFYPADRAFFEGLGDGGTFAANPDMFGIGGGAFPFLPDTDVSDIAPVWNPEAFFNTMVVNGKTWPNLDVASERYRFRLLNASDGRFLNLAMFVVEGAGHDGILGTGDDDVGRRIAFLPDRC